MLHLIQSQGVVRLRMKNVVVFDEVIEAMDKACECLSKDDIRTVVTDIRGCKPIDPPTMDAIREIYTKACLHGVKDFIRIGDGTLCAVQMRAIETLADLCDKTSVRSDDLELQD